ncbi:hypothetical protein FI667_g2016, partial [Globisporangium splendens]
MLLILATIVVAVAATIAVAVAATIAVAVAATIAVAVATTVSRADTIAVAPWLLHRCCVADTSLMAVATKTVLWHRSHWC